MELLRVFVSHGNAVVLFQVSVSLWLVMAAAGLALIWVFYVGRFGQLMRTAVFEIDEATLGTRDQTVKIRPNHEDLQIAYGLWVELTTRRIGLPIDFEHDVIVEVYNSWYEFFKVTRELVKSVPVMKARRNESTREIIRVAIDVLNEGLRPHLTRWQARFRKWYQEQLEEGNGRARTPQQIQRDFPEYGQLTEEMRKVNDLLVRYTRLLEKLVFDSQRIGSSADRRQT